MLHEWIKNQGENLMLGCSFSEPMMTFFYFISYRIRQLKRLAKMWIFLWPRAVCHLFYKIAVMRWIVPLGHFGVWSSWIIFPSCMQVVTWALGKTEFLNPELRVLWGFCYRKNANINSESVYLSCLLSGFLLQWTPSFSRTPSAAPESTDKHLD